MILFYFNFSDPLVNHDEWLQVGEVGQEIHAAHLVQHEIYFSHLVQRSLAYPMGLTLNDHK